MHPTGRLLSKLVNRPLAASNVISPAFYRAIEELRPTLLIDEADTLLPGNAQLRGILNAGYIREMAYVLRITSELRTADCGLGNGSEGESTTQRRGTRLARFSCWGQRRSRRLAICRTRCGAAALSSRCRRRWRTRSVNVSRRTRGCCCG